MPTADKDLSTKISDLFAVPETNIPTPNTIDITSIPQRVSEKVSELFTFMPGLPVTFIAMKKINLSHWYTITDVSVVAITKSCPSLEILILTDCYGVRYS